MFNEPDTAPMRGGRPDARRDAAAEGRWENEGGATPENASATTVSGSRPKVESGGVKAAASTLDARQDEIMAAASSDGRPPTRRLRMTEWRWFGVGAAVVAVGAVSWMAIEGVSGGAVVVGLALGVVLLMAAAPVLGAGLMRGQEERAARRGARAERQGRRGW